MQNTLSTLPFELKLHIVSYLPRHSITCLCLTNKFFAQVFDGYSVVEWGPDPNLYEYNLCVLLQNLRPWMPDSHQLCYGCWKYIHCDRIFERLRGDHMSNIGPKYRWELYGQGPLAPPTSTASGDTQQAREAGRPLWEVCRHDQKLELCPRDHDKTIRIMEESSQFQFPPLTIMRTVSAYDSGLKYTALSGLIDPNDTTPRQDFLGPYKFSGLVSKFSTSILMNYD